MPEKEYERLTRARPRAKFAVISSGQSSLWLGKDHLLCIDTSGYTENYKRFYYRDIQALIVRKTERYKWWGIATGVMAAGFLFAAALTNQIVVRYILGIVGGLFTLFFIINLGLGPTCNCRLQTAVQIEELPSLNRLRRWRKAMGRLRPLIAATQGTLTQEEVSSLIRKGTATEAKPLAGTSNSTTAGVEDFNVPPRIV